METIGLFLILAGLVVGHGAVTTIDVMGFVGRNSRYWTEVAIKAHKVTMPLIWIGILTATFGGLIFYQNVPFEGMPVLHTFLVIILLLNGSFLTFYISPRLIVREKMGLAQELLPARLVRVIATSFAISFLSWWSLLATLAYYLIQVR